MLGEKLRQHGAQVWLLNTGWTGGAPGVGKRMKLPLTRRMVDAALERRARRRGDPPRPDLRPRGPDARSRACPPRSSTRARPGATTPPTIAPAAKLADMFVENFKQFAEEAGPEITAAGPRGAAVESR